MGFPEAEAQICSQFPASISRSRVKRGRQLDTDRLTRGHIKFLILQRRWTASTFLVCHCGEASNEKFV